MWLAKYADAEVRNTFFCEFSTLIAFFSQEIPLDLRKHIQLKNSIVLNSQTKKQIALFLGKLFVSRKWLLFLIVLIWST